MKIFVIILKFIGLLVASLTIVSYVTFIQATGASGLRTIWISDNIIEKVINNGRLITPIIPLVLISLGFIEANNKDLLKINNWLKSMLIIISTLIILTFFYFKHLGLMPLLFAFLLLIIASLFTIIKSRGQELVRRYHLILMLIVFSLINIPLIFLMTGMFPGMSRTSVNGFIIWSLIYPIPSVFVYLRELSRQDNQHFMSTFLLWSGLGLMFLLAIEGAFSISIFYFPLFILLTIVAIFLEFTRDVNSTIYLRK